jgi:toxin ParE1/3/4
VKPVRFRVEAEEELAREFRHYEECSPGLGDRFTDEIQAAIRLAALFPGIGSPHRYKTRRVFAKSFPFSVVYQELTSELVVLAIAPFRRKPAYWRDRKESD